MPQPAQNWGQTVRFAPAAWHEPAEEGEVQAVIRGARALGRVVKVVGAAHSWSDAAASDGVMMSLDRLDQVCEVTPTPEGARVRVQAGMRLAALNEALAARGLALPILGTVTAQSVAGAISTGTHGSSLRHGNLAQGVVAARIVRADGEIQEFGAGDPSLPAVRVGLGALGVLTELTLACVPAFRLHERLAPVSWSEALADLPGLAAGSEYVKLWWLPHTEAALVFRYERTEAGVTALAVPRWVDERVVNGGVFPALLAVSRVWPSLAPRINEIVRRAYFRPQEKIARSDLALTAVMPPRHREVEHSVPLEVAGEAIRRIRAFIEAEGLYVNFPLEARFGPADDAWMSPSYGRASCHIGTYMGESRDLVRYFDGCTKILRALGGRPHWGKEHRVSPAEVAKLYPRAADFAALVRELDPDGRFRTPFVEQIVG